MTSSYYEDREQTAVKHQILARYLSAFVPIVGNWASDIAYIDCLAGPWESIDPDLKDASFARAVQVLRATRDVLRARGKFPTMRCLFIEKDRNAYNKLRQYCEGVSDIDVTARHWDFVEHIPDVLDFAKERNKSFPFTFIDPNGWEQLKIDLIRPILALEPGEVLINLMTSWITRFISVEGKGFDRLLGDDWPRLVKLKGEDQEDELVRSYANAVRVAGNFKYVCTLPVLKPNQDSFHFHMIYGTRHEKGVEVFKETEKSVIPFMHETRAEAQARRRFSQSGQYDLLEPEDRYREKKFTRHQVRSLEAAKSELRSILESSRSLLFDDAWAIAMQHSGVMDADFREWLTEWKNDKLLQITNQRPGQRLAKKGQNQYLKWIIPSKR
ncbi:MAG: three-Cys-motif partner protein TcmP [Candidatus Acidiferrales bacterium]